MKLLKRVGMIIIIATFLKKVGIIKLSWAWILSPMWLPIVIEVLYISGVRILEWLLDKES